MESDVGAVLTRAATVRKDALKRPLTNNIQVTVSNVNSIPNGTYYLTGSGGNQDWLCTTKSYNANQCVAKICKGFSDYNTCFSYFNGTWSTNGATMAPGVVWFHGDLSLGVGTYENTVIATGNLSTSGSTVVHAPNYGGLSGQCNNTAFPALYPTNFCAGGAFTAKETLIYQARRSSLT
ncbi:hypothetical protein [Ralstonia pseudosolanacearum]|uniref:hypothetical protein n=2 Tax=Ralstonia pseudosolanacearum TaxID=1310165 RepID=UPI0018A695CD|nr:hypothetical protein [Ralstonia pseudosolanacearum]MCK4150623.1 hypothetical protein [Ralstonia pseudosolanacearum]BCL89988.1 hypothetical protein MAFF211471_50760 [Ralstonia solanacearum]BCN02552.1 hypothetical protein RPSA_50880 [Ralstonia solanacearum]